MTVTTHRFSQHLLLLYRSEPKSVMKSHPNHSGALSAAGLAMLIPSSPQQDRSDLCLLLTWAVNPIADFG